MEDECKCGVETSSHYGHLPLQPQIDSLREYVKDLQRQIDTIALGLKTDTPRIYTLSEAARALRVKPATLAAKINTCGVPHLRVGRSYMILGTELIGLCKGIVKYEGNWA